MPYDDDKHQPAAISWPLLRGEALILLPRYYQGRHSMMLLRVVATVDRSSADALGDSGAHMRQ